MNTLTGLIPQIYASLNVVSREQLGFIPAVTVSSNIAQSAAVGQSVRVPVAKASTANTTTASMTIPEGDDQDIGYEELVITQSKSVQVPWPGEDALSLAQGPTQPSIFGQQMQEAFRTLANLVELDLSNVYKDASRAHGTAGTAPFATGVGDASQTRKILRDNGANGDLRLVLNSTSGANVRSNTNLIGANTAGTDATLRAGSLLPLSGITLHETGGDVDHTAGDGTGYLVNDASLAVGSTSIAVDTGSGTILAGDVISFAGDSNKYVVKTALTGGTVVIAAPGLRKAVADNAAVTVTADYDVNVGFSRSSIILAARGPAIPAGGDAARDRTTVVDPVSGLAFDIAVYAGFQKVMINIALAWGYKNIKPEHTSLLLG